LQVQLRRHAVHRVDHAAKLWDEEGVHHARRSQAEADRNPGGNDETVHAGEVLVGVDEQPFPVERYTLDVERLLFRRQRLRRIEIVRPDPGYASEEHDGQQWNGPGDELDLAGLNEARLVVSPRVG